MEVKVECFTCDWEKHIKILSMDYVLNGLITEDDLLKLGMDMQLGYNHVATTGHTITVSPTNLLTLVKEEN